MLDRAIQAGNSSMQVLVEYGLHTAALNYLRSSLDHFQQYFLTEEPMERFSWSFTNLAFRLAEVFTCTGRLQEFQNVGGNKGNRMLS